MPAPRKSKSSQPAPEPETPAQVAQTNGNVAAIATKPATIAVDIGNHKTKLAQGSIVRVIDSCVAEVLHRSQVGELDESSTLVKYVEGDRSDLVGSQWITGKDAQTYAPDSYQSVVHGENNRGKIDLGLQLLLGGLRPPDVGNTLNIKYLFATLPDVEVLGEEFANSLTGTHTIEQTTGTYSATFTVHIEQVTLKEEGQGAIAYALSKGICAPGSWNATMDFGGGTTIVQG